MNDRRIEAPRGRKIPARKRRLTLESLERRNLLATIAWENRGASDLDSDGFNAAYGALADDIRSIVDDAIDQWEDAVTSFHYAAPRADQFALTLTAASLPDNVGGMTYDIRHDAEGKPYSATIEMDADGLNDDGSGAGWSFQFGVGSIFGYDFLSTVSHEIGHALGINSHLLSSATLIGTDPHDGQASLYQLALGETETVTLTYSPVEGTHIFEETHSYDLLNSGRAADASERSFVSDLDIRILAAAYGFDVVLPSTMTNVSLELASRVLTITGTESADTIELIQAEDVLQVFVNDQPGQQFDAGDIDSVRIHTKGGNDVVSVDAGVAAKVGVDGGMGDDVISVSTSNHALIGGPGDDQLIGSSDADTLIGGDGADLLRGGWGHDTLVGGAGNDRYVFDSTLTSEFDLIHELANEGNDTLDYSQLTDTTPVTVDLTTPIVEIAGLDGYDVAARRTSTDGAWWVFTLVSSGMQANIENVIGTAGDDTLTGNASSNELVGGMGNDVLHGRSGNDMLRGGEGHDRLFGEDGVDELFGGDGDDFLSGGNDGAADTLTGGAGADTFVQNWSSRQSVYYTTEAQTYYVLRRIPFWNSRTGTISYIYSYTPYTYYRLIPHYYTYYSSEERIADFDSTEDLIQSVT